MVNKQQKSVAKGLSDYKYGFKTDTKSVYNAGKGLTKDIVREISAFKKEPKWMLDFRLRAYEIYMTKPMPEWGPDLSGIDFENIHYYIKPSDKPMRDWEDVPSELKDTFEKLGVPEAERKFLAGSAAQFESEMIYHNLKGDLEKRGIIFEGIDDALKKHPELFREHFASVVPAADN